MGLGMSLNPLFVGLYIEAYTIRMVWPLMAGISLTASAMMYLIYLYEKRRRHGASPGN
jgi:hypothetical protein